MDYAASRLNRHPRPTRFSTLMPYCRMNPLSSSGTLFLQNGADN